MFGASVRYIRASKSCMNHFFTSHCTTITRQLMELKSCSNPLKMQEVF